MLVRLKELASTLAVDIALIRPCVLPELVAMLSAGAVVVPSPGCADRAVPKAEVLENCASA